MNLIYISDAYLPSRTANSVHIVKMCEAFAMDNHKVLLIGLSKEQVSECEIFEYYGVKGIFRIHLNILPQRTGILFLHALKSFLKVLKEKPDWVFGRSFLGCLMVSLFLPRQSISFELHAPLAALNKLQKYSVYRMLPKLSTLVVISQALKCILVNEIGDRFNVDKIKVHHDAASLGVLSGSTKDLLFIDSNKIHVGYLGSIQQGRGLNLILSLSRLLPEFQFHIVGGTEEEASRILMTSCVQSNLFFHGYQPHSKLDLFKSKFDILLAPYQRETLIKSGINTSAFMSPLKIFEYMASGKPIVASDLDVIREVLNDTNAMLVPPEDVQAWARALAKLRDVSLREKLGAEAYKVWEESYTWRSRASRIIAELDQ